MAPDDAVKFYKALKLFDELLQQNKVISNVNLGKHDFLYCIEFTLMIIRRGALANFMLFVCKHIEEFIDSGNVLTQSKSLSSPMTIYWCIVKAILKGEWLLLWFTKRLKIVWRVEGGSRVGAAIAPMLPEHVVHPEWPGKGIGTETCEVDNVFLTDDLWFGSDTYTNCAVLYKLYLDVLMMGYVICI